MFIRVHHIAILVSDMERSKDFYVNKLGFKIIAEVDRPERKSKLLYLTMNNSLFELVSFPNPPKRLSHPESTGLRHLALEVKNIEEAVKKLNKKEIKTEAIRIDQRTKKKFTFFKDPDDLPIEIYEA